MSTLQLEQLDWAVSISASSLQGSWQEDSPNPGSSVEAAWLCWGIVMPLGQQQVSITLPGRAVATAEVTTAVTSTSKQQMFVILCNCCRCSSHVISVPLHSKHCCLLLSLERPAWRDMYQYCPAPSRVLLVLNRAALLLCHTGHGPHAHLAVPATGAIAPEPPS